MIDSQSLENDNVPKKWLLAVYGLVGTMILLGGITRLTGSGLSMVDWKPVIGILPPLTSEDWNKAFDLYKLYPQYQVQNPGMTLSGFKEIFFWEYIHRLCGRILGLVFIIPFIYLIYTNRLSDSLKRHCWAILLLGCMQAFLGWFMVQSGLVDEPSVSHLRLTCHLSLAFIIAGYTWWLYLNLLHLPTGSSRPSLARASKLFLAILAVQIVYGALMAGLHAGYAYNTFPDYNGNPWPSPAPWNDVDVEQLFNNPVIVHFAHRTLGLLITGYALSLGFRSIKGSSNRLQLKISYLFLTIAMVQVSLGIATIVLHIPLALASLHQIGAFVLMSITLAHTHIFAHTQSV